jgi:putative oxidoreductase
MFKHLAALIGRVLLSAIFIMSGLGKIMSWEKTSQMMADAGMEFVPVFLAGAIVLEIVGGLMLLLGFMARLGSFLLIVFLIAATLVFHNFWTLSGAAATEQMMNFTKNMAILGGLFEVLGLGPGMWSVDAFRRGTHAATNV